MLRVRGCRSHGAADTRSRLPVARQFIKQGIPFIGEIGKLLLHFRQDLPSEGIVGCPSRVERFQRGVLHLLGDVGHQFIQEGQGFGDGGCSDIGSLGPFFGPSGSLSSGFPFTAGGEFGKRTIGVLVEFILLGVDFVSPRCDVAQGNLVLDIHVHTGGEVFEQRTTLGFVRLGDRSHKFRSVDFVGFGDG